MKKGSIFTELPAIIIVLAISVVLLTGVINWKIAAEPKYNVEMCRLSVERATTLKLGPLQLGSLNCPRFRIHFEQETQDEINYYENSYQKVESVPDGYKTEEEFKNRVYYENLKVNFIENPNYKGKDLPRALNDFLKIIEIVDQDHAVALYCISEIYKKLNDNEKHLSYKKQYSQSLSTSENWRYFSCERS